MIGPALVCAARSNVGPMGHRWKQSVKGSMLLSRIKPEFDRPPARSTPDRCLDYLGESGSGARTHATPQQVRWQGQQLPSHHLLPANVSTVANRPKHDPIALLPQVSNQVTDFLAVGPCAVDACHFLAARARHRHDRQAGHYGKIRVPVSFRLSPGLPLSAGGVDLRSRLGIHQTLVLR